MMMHHTHTQGDEQNKKQSKRCHAAHPFKHTTHNTQHNQHWACMVAAHTPLVHTTQHNTTQGAIAHHAAPLVLPTHPQQQPHHPSPTALLQTHHHHTWHASCLSLLCHKHNKPRGCVHTTHQHHKQSHTVLSCLVLCCTMPSNPFHACHTLFHLLIHQSIKQQVHLIKHQQQQWGVMHQSTPHLLVLCHPFHVPVCVTPSTTNNNNNKHNGVDGATQQHNKPVVHLMCCIVAIHWLSTQHKKGVENTWLLVVLMGGCVC